MDRCKVIKTKADEEIIEREHDKEYHYLETEKLRNDETVNEIIKTEVEREIIEKQQHKEYQPECAY